MGERVSDELTLVATGASGSNGETGALTINLLCVARMRPEEVHMSRIMNGTRTRWFGLIATVGLLLGVGATTADARVKKNAELRCVQQDGFTVNPCFTSGPDQPSADGGGKSIKLDGRPENPTATSGVAFDGWWNQTLESVQQLKISTHEPVTGGSPRISIYLSDIVDGPVTHTIFLSPFYCGSSNSNEWRMSNWRSDPSCIIWDEAGLSYTGWNAYTAAYPGLVIWFAFVIQDEPQLSYVDRIQLDSKLFTK